MAERKVLVARMSPVTYEKLRDRAKDEARTIGETIALLLLENELLTKAQEGDNGR